MLNKIEISFFYRPGKSIFREKWLKDIIESKIQLYQAMTFWGDNILSSYDSRSNYIHVFIAISYQYLIPFKDSIVP